MRLTRFTDNALRCLTFLALREGESVTVTEIAARMRMSEDHLFKVISGLAEAGYVETQRGRGGGVRLNRAPETIVIGQVVRATEESFALVECFDPVSNTCPIAPACVLAGALDRALNAFLEVLDQLTLADLVRQPRKLRTLVA
ncbi:MAG: Rrf2 family transcriptional regulator [Gemmatimonadota bacterium]|nr:Rrf2 family transcriptional regulator [Gemmatimonadota bacterium]